jgi:nitrogen fixation NifU-like protein
MRVELTVWLRLDGDTVAEAGFVGTGCATSRASASMTTQAVAGRTRGEGEAPFDGVHSLVTGRSDPATAAGTLGRSLAALGGASRFPVRDRCASLAWHTMTRALDDRGQLLPASSD